MKITDERKLLPIIRDAVNIHDQNISRFKDAIMPLFEAFIETGNEKDEYHGWCFNVVFINATISDCEPYRSAIFSGDEEMKFFSEGKDDCTYSVPNLGLIKIHLHSFLWNM